MMTMHEIKEKINQAINELPEDALEGVLQYLKSINGKSETDLKLSQNLSQILKEDKNLLEKLAR